MIVDLLVGFAPWVWIILGIILMGLELLAPGVFLIWLGLAAVATGILTHILAVSWQVSFIAFAVLSVLAVLLGRAISRPIAQDDTGADVLNRRGHALLGRRFVLEAPIKDGEGRVRVDDSSWRVTGPNLPIGATVRVVRVDGTTLVIEPAPPEI